MIRVLKLRNAVYAIILGVVALIVAQVMSNQRIDGSKIALGISGAFFIIGAFLFLFPIIFAKKADSDEKEVELKPLPKLPIESNDPM